MFPKVRGCKAWALLLVMAQPCGTAAAASLPGSRTSEPPAATAMPSFDGTYHGTSGRVEASIPSCEAGTSLTLTVTGNQFHFFWRPHQDVAVRIDRNGSFSTMLRGSFAPSGKRMQALPRIDGFVDGRILTGEYGSRWCKYTFRLDRV